MGETGVALASDLAKLSLQKPKYPPAMPKVKMNLRYKAMPHLTDSDFYQYHVPKVYKDSLNFNWKDKDYVMTQDDRDFLEKLNN